MATFSYSIPGLAKLQQALRVAPGQVASSEAVAMQSSLDLVKGVVEANIGTGPAHFGFHARDQVFTKVSAGQRVAGTLYTTAPQLRWEETGTRAHEISPDGRSALYLSKSGIFAAVVHHPGERARHTFRNALAASRSSIQAAFAKAIQGIADQLASSPK